MKLGQEICKARSRAKLTQAKLAREIGCTEGYIAHIENGRSLPSERKLLLICDTLKLDKHEMIVKRQKEKASDAARPFYEPPLEEKHYFRREYKLTDEQIAYAIKVIRAIQKNDKVKTAIDLIIGED